MIVVILALEVLLVVDYYYYTSTSYLATSMMCLKIENHAAKQERFPNQSCVRTLSVSRRYPWPHIPTTLHGGLLYRAITPLSASTPTITTTTKAPIDNEALYPTQQKKILL